LLAARALSLRSYSGRERISHHVSIWHEQAEAEVGDLPQTQSPPAALPQQVEVALVTWVAIVEDERVWKGYMKKVESWRAVTTKWRDE
jgi:hypothetical protein